MRMRLRRRRALAWASIEAQLAGQQPFAPPATPATGTGEATRPATVVAYSPDRSGISRRAFT